MKIKSTKPVKPEVRFTRCMLVDELLFTEGTIATIKYSKGDDILTATGRIDFIGSYGLTGPYIRLDCSSEWYSDNVIIEADEILSCEYVGISEAE